MFTLSQCAQFIIITITNELEATRHMRSLILPCRLQKSLPPMPPPLSKATWHHQAFFRKLTVKMEGHTYEPTLNFHM